ncbi:MAG TPA: hypothetical protein VGE74_07935, partial [Gemmata sp.]
EAYVLVCPFCHDTSGHLYVNHRWAVRDPQNGTLNLWLAKCFLGDCLRAWENRKGLLAMVEGYARAAPAGAVRVPKTAEAAPGLVRYNLPHDFRLLTDLPRGHAARRYVRGRGFGPKELVREWGWDSRPRFTVTSSPSFTNCCRTRMTVIRDTSTCSPICSSVQPSGPSASAFSRMVARRRSAAGWEPVRRSRTRASR